MDLVIRNEEVVSPAGREKCDLLVAEGKIINRSPRPGYRGEGA